MEFKTKRIGLILEIPDQGENESEKPIKKSRSSLKISPRSFLRLMESYVDKVEQEAEKQLRG